MVSVIIPTYNEECCIAQTLESLRAVQGDFEVIIADGESSDRTLERVAAAVPDFPRALQADKAKKNRALQLNQAADIARGDTLLFLHADASLAPGAVKSIESTTRDETIVGGNFDLAFEGDSGWSRLFTRVNRVRRRFGIYYGDSGIFMRRDVFLRLNGFRPIPIMDDYEFVRRLERFGRTVCLPATLKVSDRRWRTQGVFLTLLSWVLIQGLYSLGVPAECLARWYKPVRDRAGLGHKSLVLQTTGASPIET